MVFSPKFRSKSCLNELSWAYFPPANQRLKTAVKMKELTPIGHQQGLLGGIEWSRARSVDSLYILLDDYDKFYDEAFTSGP
jgi:hypothetical protein